MIRWFLALSAGVLLAAPIVAHAESPWICGDTSEALVLTQTDGRVVVLKEARSNVTTTAPEAVERTLALRSFWYDLITIPSWQTTMTADESGYQLMVASSETALPIFDISFDRRIEVATFGQSASGRFVVFIQANNVASELTIFDAATETEREVRLSHNATLSAFAIMSAFSRDESCLAVSMERYGGSGPETWLIDLTSGSVGKPWNGQLLGWW